MGKDIDKLQEVMALGNNEKSKKQILVEAAL